MPRQLGVSSPLSRQHRIFYSWISSDQPRRNFVYAAWVTAVIGTAGVYKAKTSQRKSTGPSYPCSVERQLWLVIMGKIHALQIKAGGHNSLPLITSSYGGVLREESARRVQFS